jgi:hypothetical protein
MSHHHDDPITHSKVALAFANLLDRAVPRRFAGAARLRCCRLPSGNLRPKTRLLGTGDFPLLRSRRSQAAIEILGGDLRQSLCSVREFSGDAEIVKGWKPVPQRNRFRTTTRIAWRTGKILAELPFRTKTNFGASILCRHAESRPLGVSTQGFRGVSEVDQLLGGAGLR